MISSNEFRALALSFPEAIEAPHFERASFRVRGRIFATIAADNQSGMLKLDLDTHEALLRAQPKAFFSFGGFSRTGATGVHFSRLRKALLRELLVQAWRNVAPKKLAASAPGPRLKSRRFSAEVLSGHKGCAVELPFDPEEVWASRSAPLFPGRRGHRVSGSVNGTPFESAVVARSGKFFLLLDAQTLYAAHASSGDRVDVALQPGPPPRSDRA